MDKQLSLVEKNEGEHSLANFSIYVFLNSQQFFPQGTGQQPCHYNENLACVLILENMLTKFRHSHQPQKRMFYGDTSNHYVKN